MGKHTTTGRDEKWFDWLSFALPHMTMINRHRQRRHFCDISHKMKFIRSNSERASLREWEKSTQTRRLFPFLLYSSRTNSSDDTREMCRMCDATRSTVERRFTMWVKLDGGGASNHHHRAISHKELENFSYSHWNGNLIVGWEQQLEN